MPKAWWFPPSVVLGAAIWIYMGYKAYDAIQGSPDDAAQIDCSAPETCLQSSLPKGDDTPIGLSL
jgi:hypothetical protein